jgi:hypothetical protein
MAMTQRVCGVWIRAATLLVFCLTLVSRSAEADTLRVPQDYPTITQALNVVRAGDTIQVAAGTYAET